jgi:hypothetical protein
VRAVEWAKGLAGFFPWLRPEGKQIIRFAQAVACELGPNDGDVPAERIEQGRALLGASEQRKLVARFADRHPDQWAAVRSDSGDVASLERALVAGAVRAAILERRLPPSRRLADLERGIAPVRSPRDVLVVTMPPEAVWSAVDFQCAERAAAEERTEADWHAAIVTVAVSRLHEEHPRRVKTLVAALRPQLPVAGFPAASALLDEAYRRAARHHDFAASVAVALLGSCVAQHAAYITSTN